MKTKTIVKFYNENDPENIKQYLNQIIENIESVSRLVFKYLLYLILIVFVYYLLEESTLNSIELGIVKISDLKIIKIFIPPIFSIVYLIVFIGEFRREQLMHQAKVLFNLINKIDLEKDDLERHYFNDFNISFLPFYLPAELLHKFTLNKIWDVISLFTYLLLLLSLGGALYFFEFYILCELFKMWHDSLLVKCVLVITCTIVFISFFFTFKIAFSKQREVTDDNEFWKSINSEDDNEK